MHRNIVFLAVFSPTLTAAVLFSAIGCGAHSGFSDEGGGGSASGSGSGAGSAGAGYNPAGGLADAFGSASTGDADKDKVIQQTADALGSLADATSDAGSAADSGSASSFQTAAQAYQRAMQALQGLVQALRDAGLGAFADPVQLLLQTVPVARFVNEQYDALFWSAFPEDSAWLVQNGSTYQGIAFALGSTPQRVAATGGDPVALYSCYDDYVKHATVRLAGCDGSQQVKRLGYGSTRATGYGRDGLRFTALAEFLRIKQDDTYGLLVSAWDAEINYLLSHRGSYRKHIGAVLLW